MRQLVDTPARYNADPKLLFEASGSAGKLMIFAVRVRTFPLEKNPATFYIGTNSAHTLEGLRRAFLDPDRQLPIIGEYISRRSFDMAHEYGKDTFVALKYSGSSAQVKLFALKNWANGVFAKIPGLGPTFADTISQKLFALLPEQLPERLRGFRDRFEHHLIVMVSETQTSATHEMLSRFLSSGDHDGDFFECTPEESQAAILLRFGAAGSANRLFDIHRDEFSGFASLDVAFPRNDENVLAPLPQEVSKDIAASSCIGHFFCHVMHEDHIARKGVDPAGLRKRMDDLLASRGAELPAEHNFGRIYPAPEHYKSLDPCNVFNAGVGMTSPKKNWA